ncbi:carbon-nitrogen hydrolase family protein [bacterium]|nr:MAG: carbon-nitrogen hydrolase family protein [bacterium]
MNYPKFKAAAAHLSPVFLNAEKTVAKACDAIREAARNGAQLVTLPESYIPAFPVWAALWAPIYNHAHFRALVDNSLRVPGPEVQRIADTAREAGVFVSVGLSERSSASIGGLWNSNLLISDEGVLLNHHRKLVPTFFEKMVWAAGDGAGLRVAETRIGRIGALICGENTNPLARFSLMAQSEEVHISTWPPIWPTRPPSDGRRYDIAAAVRIRAGAHSFEAKAFNIVVSGFMDAAMRDYLVDVDSGVGDLLDQTPRSVSMFVGPDGAQFGESISDAEGIIYADIDVALCIEQKQFHDVACYYNRFDVFDLKVDRKRLEPIEFASSAPGTVSEDEAAQTPR